MVFPTPEFVEAEPVEMSGEIEVALELENGIFSHGMMGGKERPESDSLRPSPRRVLKCHVSHSRTIGPATPDRRTVCVGALRLTCRSH